MNRIRTVVMSLIGVVALALLVASASPDWLSLLADHALLVLMVIGVAGLVGAREKTPVSQA